MSPRIVCFGETLLDLLPTGTQPGGAPMNVAYHLKQFGMSTALITRLGADKDGNTLMSFLHSKSIDTRFVQRDAERPTGTVEVAFEGLEAKYTIKEQVAWDAIAPVTVPDSVEWLVFGSLALRSKTNQDTLKTLQQQSIAKLVFDVNLRAPYYTSELIGKWMRQASILKLNEHEFALVTDWFQIRNTDALMALFPNLEVLIITKGDKGASIYTPTEAYHHAGYLVHVADTVGSGDAFLAAFLAKYLSGESIQKALTWACAAGAFVATQQGATPSYQLDELVRSMKNTSE